MLPLRPGVTRLRGAVPGLLWLLTAGAAHAQVPPTPLGPANDAALELRRRVGGALPTPLEQDPLALFTGVPDYVRYQTWGFVLTIQNIPILEPAYWDRAIGSPYNLQRSTAEKTRQLPSAMRISFYNYYLSRLRSFRFVENPGRAVRGGALENAWSPTRLELDGDVNSLYATMGQALGSRFSPEEMADLIVFGVARDPIKRTEEDWRHIQHLFFYNAAIMGAVWFGYQFSRNAAQLRGGRWWRFSRWGVGSFLTVRRLGANWTPTYSADIRFSVPGVETAFSVGGRVATDAGTEQLGFDHVLRVNWLNYFARSLGWDVFAEGKAHYVGVHVDDKLTGRLTAESRLSGRREHILDVEGLTLGVDVGGRVNINEVGMDTSWAMESPADEMAVGFRMAGVANRQRTGNVEWAFFVAAPIQAPFTRPQERTFQLQVRLLRDQLRHVLRAQEEVARQQNILAMPVELRPPGVTTASLELRRRFLDDELRLLRRRLEEMEDARDSWLRTLHRSATPSGILPQDELAAVMTALAQPP